MSIENALLEVSEFLHSEIGEFSSQADWDDRRKEVLNLYFYKIHDHVTAPAAEASYPPCDYCGVTPDHHPWHGSGHFDGCDNPHIHACNDCRHLLPAGGNTAKLVEALEEIARWTERWVSADHPIAKVARKTLAAYRK